MADYMLDSDDDYGYEFEDDGFSPGAEEEDADDSAAQIENAYYEAKQARGGSIDDVVAMFEAVVMLEDSRSDWGFRALKQVFKLDLAARRFDNAVRHFGRLVTYSSAVGRSYAAKSFNNLLDRVERLADEPSLSSQLERIYGVGITAWTEDRDRHLYIRTATRLARLQLDRDDVDLASTTIRDLRQRVEQLGPDDPTTATFAIELCALEIILATKTGDRARHQHLYRTAIGLKTAVPRPKTMGIIYECGGKMMMSDEQFSDAQTQFLYSFQQYDEAGLPDRIRVLGYLVLAQLLNPAAEIDPFDSPELAPFQSDVRIAPVIAIKRAYAANSLSDYNAILAAHTDVLTADPFFTGVVDSLTCEIRRRAVGMIIRPFDTIRIDFLAAQLEISEEEVFDLLASMFIDGTLSGRIDDVAGVASFTRPALESDCDRSISLVSCARSVRQIHDFVIRYGAQGVGSDHSFALSFRPDRHVNHPFHRHLHKRPIAIAPYKRNADGTLKPMPRMGRRSRQFSALTQSTDRSSSGANNDGDSRDSAAGSANSGRTSGIGRSPLGTVPAIASRSYPINFTQILPPPPVMRYEWDPIFDRDDSSNEEDFPLPLIAATSRIITLGDPDRIDYENFPATMGNTLSAGTGNDRVRIVPINLFPNRPAHGGLFRPRSRSGSSTGSTHGRRNPGDGGLNTDRRNNAVDGSVGPTGAGAGGQTSPILSEGVRHLLALTAFTRGGNEGPLPGQSGSRVTNPNLRQALTYRLSRPSVDVTPALTGDDDDDLGDSLGDETDPEFDEVDSDDLDDNDNPNDRGIPTTAMFGSQPSNVATGGRSNPASTVEPGSAVGNGEPNTAGPSDNGDGLLAHMVLGRMLNAAFGETSMDVDTARRRVRRREDQ